MRGICGETGGGRRRRAVPQARAPSGDGAVPTGSPGAQQSPRRRRGPYWGRDRAAAWPRVPNRHPGVGAEPWPRVRARPREAGEVAAQASGVAGRQAEAAVRARPRGGGELRRGWCSQPRRRRERRESEEAQERVKSEGLCVGPNVIFFKKRPKCKKLGAKTGRGQQDRR